MLAVSRLLLGAGEGGGFPAATRAVAEWFPTRERSTAMGIINAGTALGGVAAPPLIALVLTVADWRTVFSLTGVVGAVWSVWWWQAYYPPEQHPRLTAAEREDIADVIAAGRSAEPAPRWLALLQVRQTWGLVLAKFLSDAAWYFYLFWLPKYLYDARASTSKPSAPSRGSRMPRPASAALPAAGCPAGCCPATCRSNRARKIALGLSAAVMPAVVFIPHVPVGWALAVFSLAYFGQQSWSTLIMILPTDLFPRNAVGSVAGLVGCGGALGGVVFGQLVGMLLDGGFGYGLVFALAGSLHVLAFLLVCAAIPVIDRSGSQEPANR